MGIRRRLASQSSIIFGGRLFGAGLIFLVQAAIARVWGAGTLGEYLLLAATINLIAVVMPLGFEATGTYFAAEYRAKGEGRLLRGFVLRAYGHVLAVWFLFLVAGYPLAGLLGEPGRVLMHHWVPASLLMLASAIVFVNGALLVGLKRPFAGFFADSIFRPLVVIGAFVVALSAGSSAAGFSQMMWGLALGYCAIAIIHTGFLRVSVGKVPTEIAPRPREWQRWWRFAVPWMIIVVATDFFFDLDLLLLAGHLDSAELAIFGVCTRMFVLVSFGVASVYAVVVPDMFESSAASDQTGFRRKIGDANLVASGVAIGLFAAVSIFGPFALLLFGPTFQAGTGPLMVLCVVLVMRAVFGPAAIVLSVQDRPYASLPAIGLGIASLIVCNLILVPMLGLMGAALAALIANTVWSVALWLTVWFTSGVDVSIISRLRRTPITPPVQTSP